MDYVITFSDVMAGVIALGGSVLVFFIRSWFNKLSENTEEIKKQIKGDFATTFVLREDFFRSMNGVEDRMRSIDGKIDKLLMQSNRKE